MSDACSGQRGRPAPREAQAHPQGRQPGALTRHPTGCRWPSHWRRPGFVCPCCAQASSALAQRTRSWCFSGALMCRGSSTTARSVYGHSITVTSDMLAYTFGGQSGDKSSSTYASSYGEEFNPTGFSLSTLTISGSTSVIPRSGHAATAWSARNGTKYVVVFGGMGFNTSSVLLNDVQVLDASSRSWVTYFAGTSESACTPLCTAQRNTAPCSTAQRREFEAQHSTDSALRPWLACVCVCVCVQMAAPTQSRPLGSRPA